MSKIVPKYHVMMMMMMMTTTTISTQAAAAAVPEWSELHLWHHAWLVLFL